jgi:hypothetical protein
VPPPAAPVEPAGGASGEKATPIAYALRLRPYCFARARFTSSISTSTTISARGLSLVSIRRSMMFAMAAEPHGDRVRRLVRHDHRTDGVGQTAYRLPDQLGERLLELPVRI